MDVQSAVASTQIWPVAAAAAAPASTRRRNPAPAPDVSAGRAFDAERSSSAEIGQPIEQRRRWNFNRPDAWSGDPPGDVERPKA